MSMDTEKFDNLILILRDVDLVVVKYRGGVVLMLVIAKRFVKACTGKILE